MRTPRQVNLSRWKWTSLFQTRSLKNIKAQLKRSRHRVCVVEQQLEAAHSILHPQGVKNHHYPLQMIVLAIFMVVHAGSSLRCAAKTVSFFAQMMGWTDFGIPSASTIRNWVLRCGVFALEHEPAAAGQYAGIIDESIQIGREKLLLLLGVRLDKGKSICAPLRVEDVEVLGMEVRTTWKGGAIAQFVQKCVQGHPGLQLSYMICDGGTALRAALRMLKLDWVSDCSHYMMNLSKALFAHDEALSQLCRDIGQLRRRWVLSVRSYLVPPSLRDKDRFHRIFSLTQWVERIDRYLPHMDEQTRKGLAFIEPNRQVLHRMKQVADLVALSAKYFKWGGLNAATYSAWEEQICNYENKNVVSTSAQSFICSMREYYHKHQAVIKTHGGRLLCCSDIIESIFGKYKNKGGVRIISSDVLAIALYPKKIQMEFVRLALCTVTQAQVEQWRKENTCHNRYSILRKMEAEMKNTALKSGAHDT